MEKTDLKTQLAEVAERIRTMRVITGLSEGEMAKCTGVPLEEYQQLSLIHILPSFFQKVNRKRCQTLKKTGPYAILNHMAPRLCQVFRRRSPGLHRRALYLSLIHI